MCELLCVLKTVVGLSSGWAAALVSSVEQLAVLVMWRSVSLGMSGDYGTSLWAPLSCLWSSDFGLPVPWEA